jgi:hypothetical protein
MNTFRRFPEKKKKKKEKRKRKKNKLTRRTKGAT